MLGIVWKNLCVETRTVVERLEANIVIWERSGNDSRRGGGEK